MGNLALHMLCTCRRHPEMPSHRPHAATAHTLCMRPALTCSLPCLQVVTTSATQRTGIPELEAALLLQSDLMQLRASPSRPAEGTVVEAKVDKGQGPVATVIVQRGTLSVGDVVVIGREWGRVRALRNAQGKMLQRAGPGAPAEISGLKGVPMAGDELAVVARCALGLS